MLGNDISFRKRNYNNNEANSYASLNIVNKYDFNFLLSLKTSKAINIYLSVGPSLLVLYRSLYLCLTIDESDGV